MPVWGFQLKFMKDNLELVYFFSPNFFRVLPPIVIPPSLDTFLSLLQRRVIALKRQCVIIRAVLIRVPSLWPGNCRLQSMVTGYQFALSLMYVCPCIIYENDQRYQLDATILFIIINNSTCFGHLYAHLQEYIRCILLHMVFSTRCCSWGPEEPVCSLVHCV